MARFGCFNGKVVRYATLLRAGAAAFMLLGLLVPVGAAPVDKASPLVLLELFTSQGCSSCPPADKLLGSLANRHDVIALSFAVDYWDYLGWHDTFGKRAFSDRQRRYAARFGTGMVYTPQLIIDGRQHVNGADADLVESAIAGRLARKATEPEVPLEVSGDVGMLRVSIGAAGNAGAAATPAPPAATLWLALVTSKQQVEVQTGENRGRSLHYFNIVRELSPLVHWSGAALQMQLPRDPLMQRGIDRCIVFLQSDDGGPVLAAAEIADW